MIRELSPRDIVGIEVIVEPRVIANMRGTFFPTTLDLKKELAEIIGLDFVQTLAHAEVASFGQPGLNSLHVFYGVHYSLLNYQGRRGSYHCFKGNFFCTEKRILGIDDPQAQPYVGKTKQKFFFPDNFSRN